MRFDPRPILGAMFVLAIAAGCSHQHHSDSASASATAPAVKQLAFASTDDALKALLSAVETRDPQQLQRLFGPEGDDLLNSGDPVADQQLSKRFLDAYKQKHRLEYNADGTSATISVGDDDWPMPIPIVKDTSNGTWSFDTEAGKDEVINRRIGRNELDVIQVCKAICDAQQDYVQRDPDNNGIPEYATKIVSDPGKKNGLYWKTQPGEQESPMGEFVARAAEEGYGGQPHKEGELRPFHGYFYRLLTAQGPHAPGGEMNYIVNGKLIGGFAIVAWPADQGNSGIMTFIADYKGQVFQKDLGPDTDKLAHAMATFDPDSTWKKAE